MTTEKDGIPVVRVAEVDGEAAMLAFGEACGRGAAGTGAVTVHLEGPLGAGKTTIARGWLRGMGFAGRVKSPTYTLMEPYDTAAGPVMHLDLYRLSDPEELEFLGLRDLSDGSTTLLIEWPERGAGHLPAADTEVHISYSGAARRVEIVALTPRGCDWLETPEVDTALQ